MQKPRTKTHKTRRHGQPPTNTPRKQGGVGVARRAAQPPHTDGARRRAAGEPPKGRLGAGGAAYATRCAAPRPTERAQRAREVAQPITQPCTTPRERSERACDYGCVFGVCRLPKHAVRRSGGKPRDVGWVVGGLRGAQHLARPSERSERGRNKHRGQICKSPAQKPTKPAAMDSPRRIPPASKEVWGLPVGRRSPPTPTARADGRQGSRPKGDSAQGAPPMPRGAQHLARPSERSERGRLPNQSPNLAQGLRSNPPSASVASAKTAHAARVGFSLHEEKLYQKRVQSLVPLFYSLLGLAYNHPL